MLKLCPPSREGARGSLEVAGTLEPLSSQSYGRSVTPESRLEYTKAMIDYATADLRQVYLRVTAAGDRDALRHANPTAAMVGNEQNATSTAQKGGGV
jgi:hypothetical protein